MTSPNSSISPQNSGPNRPDAVPHSIPQPGLPATFSTAIVAADIHRKGDLAYLRISSLSKNTGEADLAFDIGKSQGVLLADKIREVWKFYRERFKDFSEQQLIEKAKYYEGVITSFDPAYAKEINGIAAGANLPSWQLFTLNARTEIINSLRQQATKIPGECSAIYFEKAGILGQTWDWGENLSRLMVATEIQRPDGHRVFMVTEPGIIGKMGMNSSGLGVTLNILRGNADCDGVPVHILLRAVLDSSTLDEAVSRLNLAKLGTMSSLIVGDANGNHATLEFHGNKVHRVPFRCHTNHYLQAGTEAIPDGFSGVNTDIRFRRMTQLDQETAQQDVASMKKILADKDNGVHAISAAVKNYPDYGFDIGTLITIVMDLRKLEAHVSTSQSNNERFEIYKLSHSVN